MVNEIGLRPQIHQTASGRCAGQAHHAPDLRPYLPQSFPPLAAVVLKGRKLINHHHVIIKGEIALADEPVHIFTID